MNNQIYSNKPTRYQDISLKNESLLFSSLTSKRIHRGLENIFTVRVSVS